MSFLGNFRALNSQQRHAFTACFMGWSLDAFDYFLLIFCLSAIAAEFHVKTSAVAEAIFLTLAFRPVGAFLFGVLADRYGRRPTLMFNIVTYSLLMVGCAFAPSLHALLILRAFFGVAMGGEWGVGAALAFESLPKEGRGFFSGLLQEGYAFGNLMAAAAYGLLFRFLGWRGLFLVGAAPVLLIFYIGFKVQESPVWAAGRARRDYDLQAESLQAANLQAANLQAANLQAGNLRSENLQAGNMQSTVRLEGGTARQQAAPTSRGTQILSGFREYWVTFFFLVALMTAFTAFSHGTQDLFPTFLQKDRGISIGMVGFLGVLMNIGAICGGMFFGSLSERWGRKPAIITAALLTVPIIPLYAFSHSVYLLGLGAFLMQFFVQGAWGVVPAYLSELSPGPVRATFPGFAYQLGNLITSKNAVLQARAAERYGGLGRVLAATVLIVALLLALVTSRGREARGADLTA